LIIYFESSKLRKKKGSEIRMKKLLFISKSIRLFLCFCLSILLLINVIYVRAQEQDKFLEDEILRASGMPQDEIDTLDNDIKKFVVDVQMFKKMSNEELNNFISNIAKLYFKSKTSKTSNIQTASVEQFNSIQLAWLAAAQIARNYGYSCAATLVEHSVKNIPYYEYGEGLFINKIRLTSVYKDYISKLKSGKIKLNEKNSIVFEKEDNADLFYALHKVYIKSEKGLLSIYTITISDIFDFGYDNYYDDLFTNIVNNWAWLCQQKQVLHPIDVTITLSEQ